MTYHVDDSHRYDNTRRHVEVDKPSDKKWVIGGFVALVLIIGALFMFGGNNGAPATNNGAANQTTSAPAHRPATGPRF